MRRPLVLLPVACMLAAAPLRGQEAPVPKTGWSVTPMPDFSFDSDQGLKIGAYSDLFYYGDGTVYPNFHHRLSVQGAWATKGSWYLHGMFDSHTLLPGVRLTASFTFRDASANCFYGFNGIASPFDALLEQNRKTRTAYYTNHRQMHRMAAVVQREGKAQLNWMGGTVLRHIGLQDFNLGSYDSGNSLWLSYRKAGLIRDDEAGGGTSLEFRGGVTYDTRDVELSPGRGFYGELYLNANLDLSHGKYHYLQLVGHFRHYLALIPHRVVLATHVGFQHQLWGEMPYYNLSEISTLLYKYEESEGLGSRYTIRGYKYNRILAPGIAWSNLELRARVAGFRFRRQDVSLVVFPFVDLGAITRSYRLEEQQALPGLYQDLRRPVMVSLGLGGKIQINTNFMLGLDVGRALDPQLGSWTVSTAGSYLF